MEGCNFRSLKIHLQQAIAPRSNQSRCALTRSMNVHAYPACGQGPMGGMGFKFESIHAYSLDALVINLKNK
jgi:hypothetical protein